MFRERFIEPGQQLDALLKPGFGSFFIVRIEDMIKLMKLPLAATKATTHTFMFLTEGTAEMNVGSAFYKVHKDECLMVQAGQVFSIGNVDVNSGKGYLVNFHNDVVTGGLGRQALPGDLEFLTVWGNPHTIFDKQTSQYIGQLLQRIYAGYTTHGLKHLQLIQAYFIALLCELQLAYKPLAPGTQTKPVMLTNKFKELLFQHIHSLHKVSDYAALLHVTPNHLNRVIKELTGRSPTVWIDETLMLEAKALLHQTDLTVSEVAAEIGILDQSYFSRLFKKYAGRSPLEFRKMIEKS